MTTGGVAGEAAWMPWAVWAVPVVGALLTPLLAKLGGRVRDWGSVAFSLASAVIAASMIPYALRGVTIRHQVDWFLGFKAGVLADPLAVLISNIVAWVSFLIMVYSVGYMHGDPGLTRYWFFMNLFIGNMQLIVLSDNLLQLFFGWEGVGLCSYALIGYWYDDKEDKWVGRPGHYVLGLHQAYPPTHAGMKAFITTRVGDLAMLAGIFLVYAYAGTLSFTDLARDLEWARGLHEAGLLPLAFILLLGGAIGKSAQFPLHEWLPDAMAGPTSVSALIHAATMVKAGVYLLARLSPIAASLVVTYSEVTVFFITVAAIGVFTAFLAATQALVSDELKKVLAYSTVSQIGYMFAAIGVSGLWSFTKSLSSSMFHLMSHAMFKAGMFLVAGFLIHAVESRFMRDMGGLRKHMPQTFIIFTILALSLAGAPPLSGFWSKDAILASTLGPGEALGVALMISGAATALITAAYSIRMIGLVFLGPPGGSRGHELHEAPWVMRSPYLALGAATVAVGLLGPSTELFIESLSEGYVHALGVEIESVKAKPTLLPLISSLVALFGGVGLAYPFYIRFSSTTARFSEGALGAIQSFLYNRWFMNALYYKAFVNPLPRVAHAVNKWVEHLIFDNINYVVSKAAIVTSRLGLNFDVNVVDKAVNGVSSGGVSSSISVRKANTGLARTYLVSIVTGILLLVLIISLYVALGPG